MQVVRFNNCLNQEEKLYGLSYYGVIGSGILGGSIWLKLGMTFGLMVMPLAYGVCSYWAKKWHKGEVQSLCYNHLPVVSKLFYDGKYLLPSYIKCLV